MTGESQAQFHAEVMAQAEQLECPECDAAGCVECDGPEHRCPQPKEIDE